MGLRTSISMPVVLLGASAVGCGGATAPGLPGTREADGGVDGRADEGAPEAGVTDALANDVSADRCGASRVVCTADSQCCSGACTGTVCGGLATCFPGEFPDCCATCDP
jgi:hypothetical protein